MINFNGKRYAKNKSEFGPMCNGYYRRIRNGLQIFNTQRELTAFIHEQGFVVNAFMYEGRARYQFGTSEETEIFLGFKAHSKYGEEMAAIDAITEQ